MLIAILCPPAKSEVKISKTKIVIRPNHIYDWLVGRLKSPFSTKIGYIGDKVLGGDLVPPE